MRKFYSFFTLLVLIVWNANAQFTACPSDMTVNNTSHPFNQIVTYSTPTAVDSYLGLFQALTPTLTSGFASGSAFPIGTTTVTYKVNLTCDPVLQPNCSATCSFNVTVVPNVKLYRDADGDGHGDPLNYFNDYYSSADLTGQTVTIDGLAFVTNNTDCDDSDPNVWQSATVYIDHDGDGYDNGTQTACFGNTPPSFITGLIITLPDGSIQFHPAAGYSLTTKGPDCNDNNNTVWQSKTLYIDADGDGYDNGTATVCYGTNIPTGYSATTLGSDCNDQDNTVHAVMTYYRDADQDGYGNPLNPTTVCSSTPPLGYVTDNTDCNDADATISPATQWVMDADGDGYYVGDIMTQCVSPGTGYVKFFYQLNTSFGGGAPIPNELPGDCDDHNPAVHATFSFYLDHDGDGFGSGSLIPGICAVNATTPPTGYSLNNTDCDDNNSGVFALTTFYIDKDHDGYDAGNIVVCAGIIDPFELSLSGYSLTTKGSDCDDNNAAINPATVWYKDADNDGYSDGTKIIQCLRPTGYKLATELTATSGDCDDTNPILNPATVWYKDVDNDGYSDGSTKTQCARPTSYKLASELTATTGDCNDNDPTINPGAVEVCGNGIDDNCNGVIDEKACYACQNGTNLTTTNITSSSAQFNWLSTPNSRQWQIEYKSTAPGSKWIDIFLTGNLRTTILTGLKASTTYQWHMRAMCGKNWTDYSVAITFKTLGSGAAEPSAIARTEPTPELADLQVKALPNPTNTNFTVTVKGNGQAGGVKMIVVDINGRIIEQRTLLNEQTFTIGDRYFPGIYIVRFMQGEQTQQLRLIKMSQ